MRINLIYLFVCLFMINQALPAQEHGVSLDSCFSLALENHGSISAEDYYLKAYEELKKATFTLYLPKIDVSGSYIRNQKNIRLLSEDLLIPVIPYEAMQDGQLADESFWMDPANNELLSETFVTEEFGGIHFPVEDASGDYPYSDLTGGYIFKNHAFIPEDMLSLNTKDLYILNIGLYQPVYRAGKIRHANQVAQATAEYQKSKKKLREFEILLEVEHYYWLTIALEEKMRLAEQNRQLMDTLLKDVTRYYHSEIVPYAELLEVKKKQAGAVFQQLQAQNNLKLARMMMNQLIGMDMSVETKLSDTISNDFIVMDSLVLVNRSQQLRPELGMIQQQVEIAASGYEMARKRYLPEIGISSNYYFMNPDVFNGFQDQFGSNWNIGFTISFPLLDWGERVYTMRAMQYMQKAGEENLKDTEDKIVLEVNKHLFRYRELVQEWQVALLEKELASVNLQNARSNYQQGMIKHNELLKKQTAWYEAQSDYIQLFADIRLAQIGLKKAAGIHPLYDNLK